MIQIPGIAYECELSKIVARLESRKERIRKISSLAKEKNAFLLGLLLLNRS